jgi:2-(1,2-epoxy-1,2-dihydrophenyl)acetyl-CoA isomerase
MSSILFEIKNSVGIITLNRPDKLNSFNRVMALLLQDKLDKCKEKEIRCVFITGAGNAFSAGQDHSEVADPNGPGMAKILSEHYNPIVARNRCRRGGTDRNDL